MTPQRWQQVKAVFDRAVDSDPSSRAALLDELCGNDQELLRQVESLLASDHDTSPHLQSPILQDATVTMPGLSAAQAAVGTRELRRLGDYEILRPLGRGGMGSVYLACRADGAFNKNVAIKILRSDAATPDIISRFHREREILAQLDHPNIARLLDAGETDDGLPYFVMEYVEGRIITTYADHHRLPLPERIALFRQICDAVEYAHQSKVVHRDLKPGNILVTADGRVKLLDFGIASLVEHAGASKLTQTGMWLMTPEYASPEQVRGEAAGRWSDIYSLAVILFELLTGHRPYHLRSRIFNEIVRVVCEEPPTRPSAVIAQPVESTTAEGSPTTLPPETAGRLRQVSLSDLKQLLTGDLDNILLKALNKQPADRYASVLQLGADIDRHMNGESVWARSHSHFYQVGRLLSRYRVALVVAAVLVAAVVSGTIQLSWKALWWVAGGGMLIGVWHAATEPSIGRRIAGSVAPRLALVVLLVGTGLLPAVGPRSWGTLFLVINLMLLLTSISLAVAWLFRKRWAGPLISNMGQNPEVRYLVLAFNCVQMPFNLYPMIVPKLRAHQPIEFSAIACLLWTLALMALMLLSLRQEIRRDGFIVMGRLIRWSRIDSWVWEENPTNSLQSLNLSTHRRETRVLALYLHHAIKFLPPVRIWVESSDQENVEKILARQLGEWPA